MDHGFEPFGVVHALLLAGFLAGIAPVVRLGRRQREDEAGARRTGRLAALGIVAVTVPFQLIDFLPGRFDLDTTLPINLCDLAWMAAAYALWTHRHYPSALTYYWGLVLTTQGLLTPSLSHDFPDLRFFAFWGLHFLVVWSAIYLTWGLGIRPTWRGYTATVFTTAVWAVVVFGFNLVADTNYGYLNHKPHTASLLDLLGPWPLYVGLEIAIVAVVWALMTWPWIRGTNAARLSADPTPS